MGKKHEATPQGIEAGEILIWGEILRDRIFDDDRVLLRSDVASVNDDDGSNSGLVHEVSVFIQRNDEV